MKDSANRNPEQGVIASTRETSAPATAKDDTASNPAPTASTASASAPAPATANSTINSTIEVGSTPAPTASTASASAPTTKRSPIYYAAQEVWDAFGQHLSGLLSAPVCVISKRQLNDTAQNALLASAKQLGFGECAITFITLEADDAGILQNSLADSKGTSSSPHTLTPKHLFAIIEGIDPQVLIAADSESMSNLSHAYSAEFTATSPARLLGRTAVGFINFESMLNNQTDKRTAWEHLKKLGEAPKAH